MDENKFDPVKEFISLRDTVTRTLSKSLNLTTETLRPFPLVDVYETPNSIVVQTQPIPGVVTTELMVSMEYKVLTISGEVIPDVVDEERHYIKRERHIGAFSRDIVIDQQVIANQAEASFKNNILTVRLPRR